MPNVKFYYNGKWRELYGAYIKNPKTDKFQRIIPASRIYAPYTKQDELQPTFWWQIKETDACCFAGYISNNYGPYQDRAVFTQIGGDANTDFVSVGRDHLLMIKEGYLYSAGSGAKGQIGNGTSAVVQSPTQCGLNYSNWDYACAGYYISFAVRGGMLYGTGDGSNNIWYSYSTSNRTGFTKLSEDLKLKKCSCHTYHCMSVSGDGKLYAFGRDTGRGYCGLGNTSAQTFSTPTQVVIDNEGNDISEGWTDVAVGEVHTIGIRNGKLYACGVNENFALGLGESVSRTEDILYMTPVLTQFEDWKSVSCGNAFSAAIRQNGDLYTWGSNAYAQLGNGTKVDYSKVPSYVGSDFDWVRCGHQHSIACKYHDLYVWGRNRYGELADNRSKTNFWSPEKIEGNYWWRMADAGYYITVAIRQQ